MKISLVIPAHNEEHYLGACLESVQQHANDLWEVIVINNASTDRTAQVASAFPGVRVVDEPRKGLTKARQRGLTEAAGDIIAFVDADTRLPEGWAELIAHNFKQNPDHVCISGPYIYHDLHRFGRGLVWLYWLGLAWPTYFVTGYMAVGGNFAARKEALEAIGGFDETIHFYGEDTDIARRLSKVGRVKLHPRLYMYTSARRFRGEGMLKTAWRYVTNFLSVVLTKRPITAEYKDIR